MRHEREKLTMGASFRFPLESAAARRDLMVGGMLLFVPVLGWVLNMGYRLRVVHRIYHDLPPWHCGFAPWGETLRRGLMATCAICLYLSPAAGLGLASWATGWWWLMLPAVLLFVLAIFALPGGMTYNAAFDDIGYLYRPDRALRRAVEGGRICGPGASRWPRSRCLCWGCWRWGWASCSPACGPGWWWATPSPGRCRSGSGAAPRVLNAQAQDTPIFFSG